MHEKMQGIKQFLRLANGEALQDGEYFDREDHASGKLTTRLSTDAPNIRAVISYVDYTRRRQSCWWAVIMQRSYAIQRVVQSHGTYVVFHTILIA